MLATIHTIQRNRIFRCVMRFPNSYFIYNFSKKMKFCYSFPNELESVSLSILYAWFSFLFFLDWGRGLLGSLLRKKRKNATHRIVSIPDLVFTFTHALSFDLVFTFTYISCIKHDVLLLNCMRFVRFLSLLSR